MTRRTFWITDVAVGSNRSTHVRAVVSAIRVTWNPVPVKGSRVTQSAQWHRRTRHDLIAARNDRSLQHPKQLVGMPVWMAACARIGSRRRGAGIVEPSASKFDVFVSGVLKCYQARHFGIRQIGDIHNGNRIGHRVVDPSGCRFA